MKKRKLFTIALSLIISSCCFACGNNDTADGKNYVVVPDSQVLTLALMDGANSAKLSVKVTDKDGNEQQKATVTFTSADKQVATVGSDGKVTAVGAGQTTVTAKYKNSTAQVAVTVLSAVTAEQVNTFGKEYVNTFGRTFVEDGKLNVHHVASGLEVTFYGTELTADVEVTKTRNVDDPAFDSARARIYIDGDSDGVFTTIGTQKAFKIASGLSEGLHTARILKASELIDSYYTISNLSAEAFAAPPAKPDLKLEFIGDSITAGFGIYGKSQLETRTLDNSDGCKTYAYLTAQALGAEVTVVAESGICVKVASNPADHNMADLYPLVTPYSDEVKAYDFDDGVDVVVLNLGSNDAAYATDTDPSYANRFKDDYADFLSYIRSKRPDAYIICVYGSVTVHASIDKSVDKAIESLNDDKIVRFTKVRMNNSAAAFHPNAISQVQNAKLLAEFIREMLAK